MAVVKYHYGAFPPADLDWEQLLPLVGPANAALARYDGLLAAIPNAHVLLSPLITQEAVLSSRIEGTQATMGEVMEYEAGGGPEYLDAEKIGDIREILNYRQAIFQAREKLDEIPLSGSLVKFAHEVLMTGVRGQSHAPGEFRKNQNWIGPPGANIENARFVPISADKLADGVSAWEKYIHSDQPDKLVQLAIIHVEFEALHPFLDGNGRIGRLLIPLYLFAKKILATPTFYMSAYLEANREKYYDRLLAVSRDNDWLGWCTFFLRGLTDQAKSNANKARRILELYEDKKNWVVEQTHSQHAIRALDFIFDRPIFKSSDFVKYAGIPAPTAKQILKVLRDEGLLATLREGAGRRPSTLVFSELMNIAEGKDVF